MIFHPYQVSQGRTSWFSLVHRHVPLRKNIHRKMPWGRDTQMKLKGILVLGPAREFAISYMAIDPRFHPKLYGLQRFRERRNQINSYEILLSDLVGIVLPRNVDRM